jgi:hypothetical protein
MTNFSTSKPEALICCNYGVVYSMDASNFNPFVLPRKEYS